MDVMGWRGVMDVVWGEDVTCQHGNYTNDVMGCGWASHGLRGDGVLPTSWSASGTFVPDAFISFGLFNIFLKPGTNHWHRFKGWVKFDFFSI